MAKWFYVAKSGGKRRKVGISWKSGQKGGQVGKVVKSGESGEK